MSTVELRRKLPASRGLCWATPPSGAIPQQPLQVPCLCMAVRSTMIQACRDHAGRRKAPHLIGSLKRLLKSPPSVLAARDMPSRGADAMEAALA